MALYTYGGNPADVLTTATGDVVPDYPVLVRTAGTGQEISALYEMDGTPIAQLRSNGAESDQPGAIRAFQCDATEIEFEYNGMNGPVRWYEAGREVAQEALAGLPSKFDKTGGEIAGDVEVQGNVVVAEDLTVTGQVHAANLSMTRPGIYDVTQLGAAGDGIADDAPAIQAALNAARDDGGGQVLIPPGEYRLATLPLRIYGNTHLKAMPGARLVRAAAVTVLLNGDAAQNFGGYTGHGNLVIEGGTWDMQGTVVTASNMCISLGHAQNITVRDLTVLDLPGYHGIEVNAVKTARILHCDFLGYIDPGGRDFSEAIQLDLAKGSAYFGGFGPADDTPCLDVLIEGCTTGPSGTPGTTAWPRGIGSHSASPGKPHRDIRIKGCRFEGCSQFAVGAYTYEALVIEGVQMRDCGGGILVQPLDSSKSSHRTPAGGSSPTITGSQPLTGITIKGVTMSGGGAYGGAVEIVGEETGYVGLVAIDGITVDDVDGYGIRLAYVEDYALHKALCADTGSTAISTLGTRRGRIEACTVNGAGGAGITVDSRSTPASTGTFVTVSGCQVQGAAANGVHLWNGEYVNVNDCELHNLTGYGIQLSTSTVRPRLLGNRIRSTTLTGLNITSTVTGVQRWGNYVNSLADASTSPNTSSADLTVA